MLRGRDITKLVSCSSEKCGRLSCIEDAGSDQGLCCKQGSKLLTETPGQLTAGLSSQYQLSPWQDAVLVSLLSAHEFSIKFTGTQYLKDLDLSLFGWNPAIGAEAVLGEMAENNLPHTQKSQTKNVKRPGRKLKDKRFLIIFLYLVSFVTTGIEEKQPVISNITHYKPWGRRRRIQSHQAADTQQRECSGNHFGKIRHQQGQKPQPRYPSRRPKFQGSGNQHLIPFRKKGLERRSQENAEVGSTVPEKDW